MSFYEPGTPEGEQTKTPEKKDKKEKKSSPFDFLLTIAIAVGIGLFLNFFIIVNAVIPSGSMEETIMTGDRIFGSRLAYTFSEPDRYDIVIFRFPDDEKQLFIKRIIGLPGETVILKEGSVYVVPDFENTDGIDDEALLQDPMQIEGTLKTDDSFCPEPPDNSGSDDGVYRIPPGHYFMMGDNRNHSRDSRYWMDSFVERSKILGKAFLKYWPLNEIKLF